MKTARKPIGIGIAVIAAGIAFARLTGPRACAGCKALCGQGCACRQSKADPETNDDAQQTV